MTSNGQDHLHLTLLRQLWWWFKEEWWASSVCNEKLASHPTSIHLEIWIESSSVLYINQIWVTQTMWELFSILHGRDLRPLAGNQQHYGGAGQWWLREDMYILLFILSCTPFVRHGQNLHKQVIDFQISLARKAIKLSTKILRLIPMKQVMSNQFAGHEAWEGTQRCWKDLESGEALVAGDVTVSANWELAPLFWRWAHQMFWPECYKIIIHCLTGCRPASNSPAVCKTEQVPNVGYDNDIGGQHLAQWDKLQESCQLLWKTIRQWVCTTQWLWLDLIWLGD